MKRIIIIVCIALISLGALAQKGEQNIGASFKYKSVHEQFGLSVKYQQNVTDVIRLEASGSYYPKKDIWAETFDVNFNGHYLFPIAEKITAYPLAGINYSRWKSDKWKGDIGLNFGGGIQYQLTDKFRIGAEVKYLTLGLNSAILEAGISYTL